LEFEFEILVLDRPNLLKGRALARRLGARLLAAD